MGLAKHFDARVLLLHVGDIVSGQHEPPGARADIFHQAREARQHRAAGRMRDLAAELAKLAPDLVIETLFDTGPAHDAICACADRLGVDMIVMGTSGATGLTHFLIGSTAERVVRTSRVPVLTVRHDAG